MRHRLRGGAYGGITVTVDQTQNPGQWASLGSHRFTEGVAHSIELGTSATGTVVADAVKLVRDTTGDPPDTEQKTFTYDYDVNGNQTQVTDTSSGAAIDTWSLSYDGLNRVTTVEEYLNSALQHTTSFTYNQNSNPLTRTHDSKTAQFVYDLRDAVSSVTHTEPGVSAKTTSFTYTPKGLVDTETAANGNTVDYDYFLDGLPKYQVEKKPDLTVINEHTLTYTSNSHIATDHARLRNADDGSLLDRTYTYQYDPRDRLTKVTRSAVGGGGQKVQDYVLDPNGNTVSQTIDGSTTNYVYDRNRMMSATAVGGATSEYNYDPYGRLDTVVSGGQVNEKYTYDGFDRTVKHRAGTGANAKTTEYVYDPFDRTLSRTEKAGTPDEKTTEMAYLGVDDSVASETVDGTLARTYQYGSQGERLSMVKHNSDGTKEFSVYGYDTRGNVEILTNESGGSRTTYGYTAYGSPDNDLASGVDKPDPQNPDKEPYNTFRYGAKQLDPATGNYDMGARDYDPGLNRFLSRDMYNGALADIGLSTDPFTMNRYAFGGGNPLSRIEMDGHWGWSDLGHAALDVVGLVPVVGEVADLANAAWYAAEGNYADAALSAAGAIPFVGWGATAVKAGKYAYKGVDAARTGAKGVDEAADAARAGNKADAPPAGKDNPSGGGGKDPGSGSKPDQPAPTQPAPKQPDPAPPASKPDSCPIGNSFTPETHVVMADGSTKRIEDVEVGDFVLATDPETGEAGGRMVLALIVGEGDKDLVEVTVDTDAETGDDTGTIIATDGHPFWVENLRAWVDAKDLRPGDMLRTSAGTWVKVQAVREFQRHQRVHNLTVADLHTYHVTTGDTDLLVHNCGGRSAPFENQLGGLDTELARADALGVRPVSPGGAGFDNAINTGTVKWALDMDGNLLVMPKFVGGVEIPHTALTRGAPVRSAGEAEIAGGGGQSFGLSLSNHSGHYIPCACSLDAAIEAFAGHGIRFANEAVTRFG